MPTLQRKICHWWITEVDAVLLRVKKERRKWMQKS
jgi:hypothetical protein